MEYLPNVLSACQPDAQARAQRSPAVQRWAVENVELP
jgi:hypothetical protein